MTNLFKPLVDLQDFDADFFNASIDNLRSTVYQTADAGITNTAVGDAPFSSDLTLTIEPGAKYLVEACIFYDTDPTSDMAIKIQGPPFAILTIAGWNAGLGVTGVTNDLDQAVQTGIHYAVFYCGGVASGTIMCLRPAGFLSCDPIASGEIAVRYSQNSTTTSVSYLKQGSWLSLTRVG